MRRHSEVGKLYLWVCTDFLILRRREVWVCLYFKKIGISSALIIKISLHTLPCYFVPGVTLMKETRLYRVE